MTDAHERDLLRNERSIDLGSNLFGPLGVGVVVASCLPAFVLARYTDNVIVIIFALVIALFVLTLVALKPTRVFLGREGLVQSRYLRRRLAYADIEKVTYEEGYAPAMDGVTSIYLRDREQLPYLYIATKRGATWSFRGRTEPDSDLLLLRDQLMAKVAEFRGLAPDQEPALEQGDKLLTAWRDHLRTMTSGDVAGYRSAPVDPEVLVRVALNPADPDHERVAALIALPRSADPATRLRLKAITGDTTSPIVLRALDAWLAEDDAELEAALASVAKEPR